MGPNTRYRCHILKGHTGEVQALAVSPDGTWLASASNDHTLRIWDPDNGQARHCLIGHASDVRALAAGPDGRWLASASDDHTVRIWDAETGRCSTSLRTGHELGHLAIHGLRIVAAGERGPYLLTAAGLLDAMP